MTTSLDWLAGCHLWLHKGTWLPYPATPSLCIVHATSRAYTAYRSVKTMGKLVIRVTRKRRSPETWTQATSLAAHGNRLFPLEGRLLRTSPDWTRPFSLTNWVEPVSCHDPGRSVWVDQTATRFCFLSCCVFGPSDHPMSPSQGTRTEPTLVSRTLRRVKRVTGNLSN